MRVIRANGANADGRLNDSSSGVCDPSKFCQDSLQQFEFAGGLVLRF